MRIPNSPPIKRPPAPTFLTPSPSEGEGWVEVVLGCFCTGIDFSND